MTERMLRRGGTDVCAETFGSSSDPAVLLIAGGAQSMVWWDAAFCEALAATGLFVIRYDHRDTGRSSTSPPGDPDYTGEEFATDPLAVLDALGLAQATLVGLSMGGGIAQVLAVRAPDRVRALALIATSPADGVARALPEPAARVGEAFADPLPEPDWADRRAAIDYRTELERPFAGDDFDEPRVRDLATLDIDRARDPAAALTNHPMLGDAWPAGRTLADIRVPTLVLHGTSDPMFPPAHGQALAAAIPTSELVPLVGMGHEQPPPRLWAEVVPLLARLSGATSQPS